MTSTKEGLRIQRWWRKRWCDKRVRDLMPGGGRSGGSLAIKPRDVWRHGKPSSTYLRQTQPNMVPSEHFQDRIFVSSRSVRVCSTLVETFQVCDLHFEWLTVISGVLSSSSRPHSCSRFPRTGCLQFRRTDCSHLRQPEALG